MQEKNYYPFGLQHQYGGNDPRSAVNGRKHNYGFNGIELTESLDLNLYEMDLRQYDPAIARWTSIDPVTHHSNSTYNGFDNNPVFWADPSGASVEQINGGVRYTGEHAKLAFGALQKQYGGTDPKKKKKGEKKKATVTTGDPVAYGIEGDNNRSEMPDFIKSADVGHYNTSFTGTTEEYNLQYGTDYVAGEQNYNKYYYDFYYRPRLSALRGSIQASQAEAAEMLMYILPTGPTAAVGAVKGAMSLGRFSKHLKTTYQVITKGVRRAKTGDIMFSVGVRNRVTNYMIRLERGSFNTRKGVPIFTTHINYGLGGGKKHLFLNRIKKAKIKL
ncbi:RHS repeat-associated core domain-containing protein [Aquimarina sp. MAR_2010_214]|uniref:RHS repeat-associated core domain-containing protein n=1 Tax=Aquimarina sp. MAR_2010_214 TaxID=1250026 RepID=UPI000C71504F|nr:RHS repeat-associated core domain-containing protein [Aquimarina sp. MAR_2010_214]